MTKDILIHQSHDGTWSAQQEDKYFRPFDQVALDVYPYYFGDLVALLNCILAYEQQGKLL